MLYVIYLVMFQNPCRHEREMTEGLVGTNQTYYRSILLHLLDGAVNRSIRNASEQAS